MMRRLFRGFGPAMALALFAAACGDSPTSPTPPPTPPPATLAIACPAAQSGTSLQNQPVTISWPAPTTTGGTAPVQTACTPASGSAFMPGVTTVTCTATDAASQRATCTFAVTISRPPQLSVTRFLAYGDSITWGRDVPAAPAFAARGLLGYMAFPEPPPPTSYPSQLLNLLAARYVDQSLTVVNEGWPGEAINDGLNRLPGVLAQHNPEVLLLLDGANDLLGRPSSATTQYIAGKLRDMIRSARGRIPTIRVLLAKFPPQYHGTIPYDRGAGADYVPELNQRIAEVARSENVVLVDLYSPMEPNLKQNIGQDGLHPTIQGYTVMADVFNTAIMQQFEARTGLPSAFR
jgi:lysophospholipase L1-like esterase